MKITIEKYNIQLREPFHYYLGTLTYLPYTKVTIDHFPFIGVGEAPCSVDVNGETQESSCALEELFGAFLKMETVESIQDVEALMQKLKMNIAFNAATFCGVEQALLDLVAQKEKQSLLTLLGQNRKSAKIQTTIPYLDSLEAYKERLEKIASKKPEYIKFKVGKDLGLEEKAIQYAKTSAPQIGVSLDANQAFATVDDAYAFLSAFPKETFTWTEQMLPQSATDEFSQLKKKTGIKQMVDESVHTAHDALLYCQNEWADMINIKLAKTGGIFEAKKIIAIAKKYHKPYMLGSMVHSELGLRYNLAFAMNQDFITHDFYSYFSLQEKERPYLIREDDLTINAEVL